MTLPDRVALGTKHGKSVAVAPPLGRIGIAVAVPKGFGTFTGEVARAGSMLDAARPKARAACELTELDIGIGSESSHGPNPHIPLLPLGRELVLFWDRVWEWDHSVYAAGRNVFAHRCLTAGSPHGMASAGVRREGASPHQSLGKACPVSAHGPRRTFLNAGLPGPAPWYWRPLRVGLVTAGDRCSTAGHENRVRSGIPLSRTPRDKALSIYDIARHLGISSGTVSRAFNNHPEVSRATRERILAKARELGYTPSPLARGLARNVTSAIGIVIPTVYDPFFLDFAQGVQQAAAEAGVAVMMSFTDHAEESLHSAVRSFEQFRVAGVLLLGGSGQHDVELRAQFPQLPIVVALRRSRESTFPAVFIDHKRGALEMMQFLVARGHRSIGYVGLPPVTQAALERLAGYRDAVATLGATPGGELIAEGNAFADGITATDRLLAQARPDAIFYASDALATGGLHALAHRALRVPDEIAVAGFGDIISSSVTVPALTTVHVPMREIGARSVALLLRILADGDEAAPAVQLETTLVVRESA